MRYFEFAVTTARDTFTSSPATDPRDILLESVTIAADAMPHHYTARAVVLDLQPADMLNAIAATEDRIRARYPHFRRTGWRAACDGLTVYFTAWTPTQIAQVA